MNNAGRAAHRIGDEVMGNYNSEEHKIITAIIQSAIEAETEKITQQRDAILQEARMWAFEAKGQRHTVNEVGSILGGIPDWGPIVKGVRAKDKRIDKLEKANEKLRGFARYIIGSECFGESLDGGNIQEKAEKLGFIYEVEVTEADLDHPTIREYGMEVGESWYKFMPIMEPATTAIGEGEG